MTIPTNQAPYIVAGGTGAIPAPIREPSNPTSHNTSYPLYQIWINTLTGIQWQLVSFTAFDGLITANWVEFATSATVVQTLTGNTGGAVGPTGGTINVVGDGTTIDVVGNPSTSTLTLSVVSSGVVDSLTATAPLTANAVSGTPETGSVTVALTTPLALTYGGTNASLTASDGGIFYSTASAGAILAGTVTAKQMLQSGASIAPAWSTATWPSTTTANDILYSSAANTVGQITTADNGVLISGTTGIPSWLANSSTAGYVLTANSGAPPSWQNNSVTQTYSAAAITVSPTAGLGQYTTIGAALTASVSGDNILLLEGTYTENPALKAGVNLVAWDAGAETPTVTIVGECTFSSAGTVSISGIRLQTNSNYLLSVTGSAASIVNLNGCYLSISNNTAIQYSSSSGSSAINLYQCVSDTATTGIAVFAHSSGGMLSFNYCFMLNDGASTTANTASAGLLDYRYSLFETSTTCSGSNVFSFVFSALSPKRVASATSLTTSGSATGQAIGCDFESGSAGAISVGSGTTVSLLGSNTINSSATDVISGSGTLNYNLISFTGSSSAVSVSTQNPLATLPSLSSSVTTVDGDSGAATPSGGVLTVSGGSTGLTTSASSSTVSLTGTLKIANGGTNATSFTQSNGIVTYNGTSLVNYAGPQLNSSGIYSNASQPAFFVYLANSLNNQTGAGASPVVVFDTALFDTASAYNTTAGTYTVPVTGVYIFNASVWVQDISSAMTVGQLRLFTAGANVYAQSCGCDIYALSGGNGNAALTFGVTAYLTASTTVSIVCNVQNGGGNTAGFIGNATPLCWFSGAKIA